MKDKYFLTDIIRMENSSNMVTILLSAKNHGACIEIHGTYQEATDRMLTILKAFNE